MCPGLHTFASGYSVVWWDPSALDLDRRPPFGVRREDLIVKDVPPHIIVEGRGRYDRWLLARTDARDSGAVPSLAVQTVREFDEPFAAEVDLQTLDLRDERDLDRPRGVAFGLLVHELLALVPFDASAGVVAALAESQARLLGLDDDDAGAAARAVAQALRHELFARARAADARGACRRETPVTLTLDDGRLLEGIVDLAFEDGERWMVIDYKTDAELAGEGEARYRQQLALYTSAVARATERCAVGVLVRV